MYNARFVTILPASAHPRDVSDAWILQPAGRPLFVYAHQDDEAVMAGIIRRTIGDDERGHFIWWTNGDGLAPGTGMTPKAYGDIRIREATASLEALGGSANRKTDLETSEIENYRRFTHVAQGGAVGVAALEYFRHEARRIETAIRDADPDRVFLLAYQGGHPEHDLTHIMTARAVQKLRTETGRPIPIIQCPAYEYIIACALRFKPWFQGDLRHMKLSPEELIRKHAVLDAYPSQKELLAKFEVVLRVTARLSAIRGHSADPEEYLGTEQFGVVPPDFDYTQSSHRIERLNYIGDDFEGIPVRFDTMVRRIAADLLGPQLARRAS